MSISTIIIIAAAWTGVGFSVICLMHAGKKADQEIDEEYLRMRDERNRV